MAQTIKGQTGEWEIVIGMEVHAQVLSESKLFSGASTTFGKAPNHNVALVDAALPGMLPVLNEECVRQAVRSGLGIKAEINLYSVFDRKNYFYADLPQGYQISQLYHPIVGEGELTIDMEDGESRVIGIERIHLEQDAGKSIHDQDPHRSFIDLNRTGVALMEIVSKPDLRGGDEASAYMTKLRSILRYLGTCDGNMEQGSMRADVNVSVRPVGSTELGTRTETKNVNSVRFIRQTVEYEARRQVESARKRGDCCSGNPPLRPGKGRDAVHALQGRSARLPLLPRSRLAAAAARSGVCRCDCLRIFPSCLMRSARGSRRNTAYRRMTQAFWLRRRKRATSLKRSPKDGTPSLPRTG